MRSALEFSVEEFFDEETGDYRPQMLVVSCPDCHAENHPLPGAHAVWVGWRWLGVSHQEPQTDYESPCQSCGHTLTFTVRSPQ